MKKLPFRLLLITDWSLADFAERVDDALQAGPGIAVQHRDPGSTARHFFDNAWILQAICSRREAPLFINGRLDVALAVGAHLHLPVLALPVDEVRAHLPSEKMVSVSAHRTEEFQPSADLTLLSPVFQPSNKRASAPMLGAGGFDALAARCPTPAFALGGMTPVRSADLLTRCPRAGVAVMGAVFRAPSPRAAASAFLEALPQQLAGC